MSAVLVKVKEMFSFQQGVPGEAVRLIADSCRHLKKLNLHCVIEIEDGDVIHVIDRLGNQLTTLVLDGECLTDVACSHLRKCAR